MKDVTPSHIDLAIAVRRGQKRIRDLPAADRDPVRHVLDTTSSARLAQTAESQMLPRRYHDLTGAKSARGRFGPARR